MYDQNPYTPQDAIVSKRAISVGNFPVGALLGWASGREVLSIPTFGMWLEVRPSATQGVKAIIRIRRQKPGQQGKPWEDSVGWIKETPTGGELTLPAVGVKYVVAPAQQQGYGQQPQYPQPSPLPQLQPQQPSQSPASAQNQPIPDSDIPY